MRGHLDPKSFKSAFKKQEGWLGWVSGGGSPRERGGHGCIPHEGTGPSCGLRPQDGACRRLSGTQTHTGTRTHMGRRGGTLFSGSHASPLTPPPGLSGGEPPPPTPLASRGQDLKTDLRSCTKPHTVGRKRLSRRFILKVLFGRFRNLRLFFNNRKRNPVTPNG